MAGHDVVVLLDCNTLLVQDPASGLDVTAVVATLADLPTVSLAEFEGIFRHFQKPMPPARYTHELTGDPCIAYCNSGVIIIPEEYRSRFTAEWDRWNRAVLNIPETVLFNRLR